MIVRRGKYEPAIPRGKSSSVKHKIIELDRKFGSQKCHVYSQSFVDRGELAHLVDQAIHDMEGIGYESDEGENRTDNFYRRLCRLIEPPRFECKYIFVLFIDKDVNHRVIPPIYDREGM